MWDSIDMATRYQTVIGLRTNGVFYHVTEPAIAGRRCHRRTTSHVRTRPSTRTDVTIVERRHTHTRDRVHVRTRPSTDRRCTEHLSTGACLNEYRVKYARRVTNKPTDSIFLRSHQNGVNGLEHNLMKCDLNKQIKHDRLYSLCLSSRSYLSMCNMLCNSFGRGNTKIYVKAVQCRSP